MSVDSEQYLWKKEKKIIGKKGNNELFVYLLLCLLLLFLLFKFEKILTSY